MGHAILHLFSDQQWDNSTFARTTPRQADEMICHANEILFDFLSEDAQSRKEEKPRSASGNSLPHAKPTGLVKRVDVEEAKKGRDKKKAAASPPLNPAAAVDQEGIAFLQSLSSSYPRQVSAPVTCKELESAQQTDSVRSLLGSIRANSKPSDPAYSRNMSPPPPPPIPESLQNADIVGQKLDPQMLFAAAAQDPRPRSRTQSSADRHSPIPSDDDNDSGWSRRAAKEQAFRMILQWKDKVNPSFFAKCGAQIEVAKSPLDAAKRINATAERLEARGYLRDPDEGTENMLRMACLLYHRYDTKSLQHMHRAALRSPVYGFSVPPGVVSALQLPAVPPGSFVASEDPASSSKGSGKGKGKHRSYETGKAKGKSSFKDSRGDSRNDADQQTVLLDELLKEKRAADGKQYFEV